MRQVEHCSEETLIAYQMGEIPGAEAAGVRAHLEVCEECAGAAEQIAETLRVYSAEPVRAPNVEHAWQRLRGSLPGLAVPVAKRVWWRWVTVPALLLCLAVGWLVVRGRGKARVDASVAHVGAGPLSAGPLSTEPLSAAPLSAEPLSTGPRDPALAAHVAEAERLLTELRHAPAGGLDAGTRAEAETFRMRNAAWVRQSREAGEAGEAAVLEEVDRTLTTLGHERGAAGAEKGWHVRFEMSTDGLLLDLRVLEQNDTQAKEKE